MSDEKLSTFYAELWKKPIWHGNCTGSLIRMWKQGSPMAVEATQNTQNQTTPASVLVCTRNRPQDLEFALPTSMAQAYPNFEVVLIDQSTNDDTERLVRKLCGSDPRVRYIRTNTVGLSIARNMALTEARYDICAFTDDDCE